MSDIDQLRDMEIEQLVLAAWNSLSGQGIPESTNVSAGTIAEDGIRKGGMRILFWLSDSLEVIHQTICMCWKYPEVRGDKVFQDYKVLIPAIADWLSSVFGFIPGFTVSSLLCTHVLDKLCESPHPNKFIIDRIMSRFARRADMHTGDRPYFHNLHVAVLHYEIGEYQKTYERIRQALACAEGPRQRNECMNNLAFYALLPIGEHDQVIEIVDEILPEASSQYLRMCWMDTLGCAYLAKGQTDNAASTLQCVVELDPDREYKDVSQLIRLHAAKAQLANGQIDSARDFCQEVFQIQGSVLNSYRAQELLEAMLLHHDLLGDGHTSSHVDLEPDTPLITSRNSRIVHLPSCQMVKLIEESNRFTIASMNEARTKGLRGCKYCLGGVEPKS